jgi:hypothetical protein
MKNSEIFLKKCQKKFRLSRSWRPEILHEQALLVQTLNCILRFGIFRNSLENFLIFFEIFLKNVKNSAMSVWVEARELNLLNMLC